RYTRLPLDALPAGAVCAHAKLPPPNISKPNNTIKARLSLFISNSLARVGDHIDQCRFAAFDDGDRALERGSQILRIGDRPLGVHAEAFGYGGVVDVRIGEGGSDVSIRYAAAMPGRHRLKVHVFLVIGTIVVHHVEDRDAVMRGSPQRAWHEHQVAVALDRD